MSKQQQMKALKTILKGGVPEKSIRVFTGGNESTLSDRPKHPEIGDTWEDENGKIWEQKNGYVANIPKMSHFKTPTFCPTCNKIMKRVDNKMWMRTGKCLDCTVDHESELRAKGLFELYEKYKLEKNIRAWIRDMRRGLEDVVSAYSGGMTNVFDDGRFEQWDGVSDEQAQEMFNNAETILSQYEQKADNLAKEVNSLKNKHDIKNVQEEIIEWQPS